MSFSLTELVKFDPSNLSAFGTLETNELHAVIQLDFVYGINTQTGVNAAANSATVDTNVSRLRLQCGTNPAGDALFYSRKIAKYRPGLGVLARFTAAFDTGTADNTQIVGAGSVTDGYFFGYNGTSFGILHRNNSVDTWIPQASWNGDKADGSGASAFNWNKSFGNVMMIKYPYLGYGDINFFVEDANSGRFILVHTIKYANTSKTIQLLNPNLSFWAQNINTGSTTNLTMYVGSVGFFLSGVRTFTGNPKWAADATKTNVTAEALLLSLRNCTTYNGVTNRGLLRLNSLSYGASGNSYGNIRLKIGATIGGSPSYTPISGNTVDAGVTITGGNSIASVDTAGSYTSGGSYRFNVALAAGQSFVDLSEYELFIAPGETLTITGQAATNTNIAAALNWAEDI